MNAIDHWSRRLRIPPALLIFWLAIVAMTLASAVYTLVVTYVFKLPYPYGLPLFFSDDRWFDFSIYHDRMQAFRTPAFWGDFEYPFTYPAPLAVLYGLLYKIPHALRYYLVAYAAAIAAGALMLRRALVERGIGKTAAILFTLTFLLTSYPLRVLFESANTEGWVAILAAYGIYFVLRDRCWLGGALIAVAGTMKVFPFILLALLLSKRRYREFAWSLGVAAATSLISLAIVGPSVRVAQQNIDAGIRYVKDTFIFSVSEAGMNFNHSLFTPIKYLTVLLDRSRHPAILHSRAEYFLRAAHERALLNPTLKIYMVLAAIFGFVTYFGWIRRLPMLNQVLALCSCSLFLPPLSADYTLLHLIFPFALLCFFAADQSRSSITVRGLTPAFLCIAPIFAFQTYLTWRYRFSCEARTLGLVALFLVALRYPFFWTQIDSAAVPRVSLNTAPSESTES